MRERTAGRGFAVVAEEVRAAIARFALGGRRGTPNRVG
jgi:hypothetical protein